MPHSPEPPRQAFVAGAEKPLIGSMGGTNVHPTENVILNEARNAQ